jgi:hypothetical protein
VTGVAIGGSNALLSVPEAAAFLSVPLQTAGHGQTDRELAPGDIVAGAKIETVQEEWGVTHDRGWSGSITICESEEAARQLQTASGGELVSRSTYTWSCC